jgi:hypothetical protein
LFVPGGGLGPGLVVLVRAKTPPPTPNAAPAMVSHSPAVMVVPPGLACCTAISATGTMGAQNPQTAFLIWGSV